MNRDILTIDAYSQLVLRQHEDLKVLIVNYAFAVTKNRWLDGFEAMIG